MAPDPGGNCPRTLTSDNPSGRRRPHPDRRRPRQMAHASALARPLARKTVSLLHLKRDVNERTVRLGTLGRES